MGAALTITRTDHTAAELRVLAGRCRDGAQVRRMLALGLVLEGRSRTEAAEQNGMDRQTLRDWVHRYNTAGIEGLKSHRSSGRMPLLSQDQMAELRALVVQGPDPAQHKVVPSGGSATGCFAVGSPRGDGAAWTCARRSLGGSRSKCTRARWGSGCASSA